MLLESYFCVPWLAAWMMLLYGFTDEVALVGMIRGGQTIGG
jgi:hypothetical protein